MVTVNAGRSTARAGSTGPLWQSLSTALPRLSAAEAGLVDGHVTVLDCGGGSGSLAVRLAAIGAQVTVVDVSPDALSTLVRRAEEAGVGNLISAVQGEAESLGQAVAERDFGLVMAHDILASVTDARQVLAELIDRVAPGGLLSIINANPVSAVLSRALAGDAAGAYAILSRGATDALSAASVVEQCSAAGLVVEAVVGLGVFSDLVSGKLLDTVAVESDFARLEEATYAQSPYRDIAARIHVLAAKPR